MRDQSKRARGRWGEDRAASHLERSGYRVIDRNWRSPEQYVRGELDIVATCDDVLVFCEVKARRDAGHFGGAAAAVGEAKQTQIRTLADSWIRQRARLRLPIAESIRFDVIAIDGVRLEHIERAF